MLYKLVFGYPEKPPKEFVENGRRIIGFTDDFLRERGYKPVAWSEPTSDNQMDYYVDHGDYIEQRWDDA